MKRPLSSTSQNRSGRRYGGGFAQRHFLPNNHRSGGGASGGGFRSGVGASDIAICENHSRGGSHNSGGGGGSHNSGGGGGDPSIFVRTGNAHRFQNSVTVQGSSSSLHRTRTNDYRVSHVPVRLNIQGRSNPSAVTERVNLNAHPGLPTRAKSVVSLLATKHLAYMNWTITKDEMGILYTPPDGSQNLRNLVDACAFELCRVIEEGNGREGVRKGKRLGKPMGKLRVGETRKGKRLGKPMGKLRVGSSDSDESTDTRKCKRLGKPMGKLRVGSIDSDESTDTGKCKRLGKPMGKLRVGSSDSHESTDTDSDIGNVLSCELCNSLVEYNSNCCSRSCKRILKLLKRLIGKSKNLGNQVTWEFLKGNKNAPESGQHPDLISAAKELGRLYGELAKNMVFSSKSVSGFFTCFVRKDNVVASIATFRVHAEGRTTFAEIPYVLTLSDFRGEGLLRSLMDNLEDCLRTVRVEVVLLSSIEDAKEMWISSFGFAEITGWELGDLLENTSNIETFSNTQLLCKYL